MRRFIIKGFKVIYWPKKSTSKDKKLMVKVKRLSDGKTKTIHFGQRGYGDYTRHGDKERRRLYDKRSGSIRDKYGRLTKNNPFSANFWARRWLWGLFK